MNFSLHSFNFPPQRQQFSPGSIAQSLLKLLLFVSWAQDEIIPQFCSSLWYSSSTEDEFLRSYWSFPLFCVIFYKVRGKLFLFSLTFSLVFHKQGCASRKIRSISCALFLAPSLARNEQKIELGKTFSPNPRWQQPLLLLLWRQV